MALNKIKTSSLDDDSVTSAKLANGAVTANDISDGELPLAKISQVNLDIAPEVLEIQVAAPQAGQDTQWLWTWLTSSLPYARRDVTNSPEVQVPLYKQGTYTVNNYAAYDLFDQMTQTHSLYLKWIDGAGTDNLIDWATSTGPVSDSHPDINGGSATDVQRISISVPTTITPPTLVAPSVSYTVTNNGSGAYTFSGAAKGDNTNIGPMYRGGTYTFNVSATGHPLYFTTDNGTNYTSGGYFGEYTDGVTGSRTDDGTVTIIVPVDAPDTLYYQCGVHGAMRGAITIKDLAVETNVNGNYVVYFQHTQEGHKTPVELRPIPSLVNQMCLVYDATSGQFVPQDLATYVENTPSFENKIREVAGTAELVIEDGSAVVAKVNVYDDSTYLPLTGNNPGDQAFATDNNTLYIWSGNSWTSTKRQLLAGTNITLATNSNGDITITGQPGYTDTDVDNYLSSNNYATETYVDDVFDVNYNTNVDTFTAAGSSTFTLSISTTSNNAFVYVNDVIQRPDIDYTINGSTLNFVNGVDAGDEIVVRITNHSIPIGTPADGTISNTKLASNLEFSGQYIGLPVGTTAERPLAASVGYVRFNTDINALEQYTSTGWVGIEQPPAITGISPTTYDGDENTTITINGSGFATGATVLFITSTGASLSAGTTTYISSAQITATTPRDILSTESPITVKVTNPAGLTSELPNSLDAGDPPNWDTASGTLATISDSYQSNSISVSATDPEGSSISYALESGAIPAGMTFNNGTISGTASAINNTTTSSFTVSATDVATNRTDRSFSIITNPVMDGTTANRAAGSALDIIENIRAAGGTQSDWEALEGALWINPGMAYTSAFEVWCDMTTQGGGWTLAIKWDQAQSTTTDYSLGRTGGRSYSNINELGSLDPQGSMSAFLDMRDIINYDRIKTHNSEQFGGRFTMHASTSNTSNISRSDYTGHNFTASVPGANVGNTLAFSPLFAQFHTNMYDGSNTTNLWNTQGSWITDDTGAEATEIQSYNNASDISQRGGGVFYGLSSDVRTIDLTKIDVFAADDIHSATPSGNVVRSDTADGLSHFSTVSREGSVYCSGTGNTAPVVGHNSPKFNWGWYSADGTQMSYGMGDWTIGTPCRNSTASGDVPTLRMNYMFIR